MNRLALTFFALCTSAALAYAAVTYPVSGQWGEMKPGDQGAVDCAGRHIITFNGDQRTDSSGGVRAFRIYSSEPHGSGEFLIVDQFANGQVRSGRTTFTLKTINKDRIELRQQGGHVLTLQRCK
jgi:hypothetical protein